MTKKRRTNGYGTGFADILVKVTKPHDKNFVEAGFQIHSDTDVSTTFTYTCSNRYSGDDESVVQYLWHDLPEGVEGGFEIDWPNSTY